MSLCQENSRTFKQKSTKVMPCLADGAFFKSLANNSRVLLKIKLISRPRSFKMEFSTFSRI